MKLVIQNSPTTCGQACIATILNISLEDAIKLVGHDQITSDQELLDALWATRFTDGPPPIGETALQKHKEPNGNREHWTVWDRNQTLDPAQIRADKLWPVYKHVIVYGV